MAKKKEKTAFEKMVGSHKSGHSRRSGTMEISQSM